jgi:hypothetical protein
MSDAFIELSLTQQRDAQTVVRLHIAGF